MLHKIKHSVPKRTRAAMRVALWLFKRNRKLLGTILRTVALRSLVDVLAAFEDEGAGGEGHMLVRLRRPKTEVLLRYNSSDFAVFRALILKKQYAVSLTDQAEYIVDAGANIGLASLVFLDRYPHATVLSIEPDPENFSIACKNLAGYGMRCKVLNAALWDKDELVSISRGTFRDGRAWATETIPLSERSEISVQARSLQSLLDEYSFPKIDLLKIDIEGAELRVFANGNTDFLERTNCCAIECHGPECVKAFSDVAIPRGFILSEAGELTIAKREASQRI